MDKLIQILHLEDDALDAELIRSTLDSAGIVCQVNRVQNRDEFTQALHQRNYDLILADYRLPAYDGVSALRLAQELRPELPFIFVSGTLGEDAAIDGFTQGATDYVLKHKLARLAPAVERALREADNRRLRQQAEAALHERVQQSQSLLRLSRQLERAQTYDEIVNAALAEVRAIIGYQNLWVYLLTEDQESCMALMADGQISKRFITDDGIAILTIKGDPMLEEIASVREIVIVEDAQTDDRTDKAIVAQVGNRTIVNVPIILSDRLLGAVGTGTFGAEGVRVPTPSEQEYLMTMASHLAVSLDRLRLSELRQQAEVALRKSEQKFRSLVEESSEGFTLVDEQGTLLEWNRAREKMTGLASEQVLGRALWDVQYDMLPPEVRTPAHHEHVRQVIQDALQTGQSPLFDHTLEAEVMTQAGERRFVQQTVFPIKTDLGYRIGSTTRDITERKQADMQLLASEQLFRALVENSPDFIARYDRDYRRIYVNPAIQQLFRGLTDNVLGETPARQTPVYAPQVYIDHLRQVIETATESAVEMPYRTAQGEMHWGHMRFVPEFDQDGKVASVLAIGRDIHDIKENERRFRMLAENFPDFVVRFDHDGRFTYVNPAFEKAFGLPADVIVGKTLQDLPLRSTPEQNDTLLALIRRAFDEGVINETEATWESKAGERIFEVRQVPEKDAAGNVVSVLSIAHDITEAKRAEQEHLAHLRFLGNLDQFNRAMQGTHDLNQVMSDVLDALLAIFDCDRAWLVYPCDPAAATWQVPMERTRPEYPGVFPIGVNLPLDPMGGQVFRSLCSSNGPVQFGPGAGQPVPTAMAEAFNLQSFIAMAMYPKVGQPWAFGLHQCSYPRIWTPEEERLLQEIGRRLSDTLTSLLIYRDLRESEERFSTAFRFSPIAIGILRAADGRFVDVNDVFVRTAGYSREEIIGHTSNDLHFWVKPEQQAASFRQLQAQGSIETFEFELRTKAGEIRIGLSATAQIELNGEKHYLSLIHDITDRKRAEEALRTTKILLEQTLEQSPVPMILVSMPDAMIRYANTACLRFLGIDDEPSLIDTPLLEIKPSFRDFDLQGREGTLEELPLVRSLKGLKTEGEERYILRKDGTIRYELVSGTPIFDDTGQIIAGYLIMMDITERKRAEEALRESQALYHSFVEQLPNAVFRKDSAGRYVMVNSQFCRLKGLTAEDFLGRTALEVASSELARQGDSGPAIKYADQGAETHDLIMRTGKIIETEEEHPRADGGVQYTYVIRMPVFDPQGKVVGTQGIHFDITDRKRAEARILRLNRLYATLSQINQTIVHLRDRRSLFEQICRVAVEHGQFRLAWIGLIDEAMGQIVPTTFAGEEQGYLANTHATYRDEPYGRGPTGTAIREGHSILCQDIATDPGMAPWRDAALQRGYRSSAAVPIRQNGRVVGALTVYAAEPHSLDAEDESLLDEISLDISFALDGLEQDLQRQRAEDELSRLNAELEQRVIERTAELARAHERLRAILDTAGEGVVFTDPQATIEYINPAMERLTGFTADEALGHNPRIWKSDQTPPATHQHMWRALTHGETWQGEVINRRKDGGLYDAALTTSPVTDVDGHIVGYVGVQRDITQQKELDRLKDQFVSNVSHELRTPIANVMLHISLLTRGRPERHDIYLRTLQREADRLRNMIEDLLDLSRLDRNVTPIELTATDIHQLLGPLVGDRATLAEQRGLTLKYEPAPDLPLALSDASKLTQVIANLLTNALNYTPAGGEVTVSSAARQPWITITVRDTGPGIAARDLPHLFERFYRGEAGRKADAPGTGLGLAISHEIIDRLGARITVESEPGHGAAFTVWVKADNEEVTR